MMEWYANQNQAKREHMWSELDQIGDEPLWVGGEPRNLNFDGYPVIGSIRHFVLLLSEQSIVMPKETLPEMHCRMLRLMRSIQFPCLIGKLVLDACVHRILTAIAERISDLKGSEELIAGELDRLIESLEKAQETVWQEEFMLYRRAIHNRDPEVLNTGTFFQNIQFSFYFRLGRANALRRLLSLDEDRRSQPQYADRIQAFRLKDIALKTQMMDPWKYLFHARNIYHGSFWGYGNALHQKLSAILYAKLLVAELRKTPWPIDSFDPAGGPLRPLERDGKVIGAYSVGLNGIDDKGTKHQDALFPLYGPLFVPKPVP